MGTPERRERGRGRKGQEETNFNCKEQFQSKERKRGYRANSISTRESVYHRLGRKGSVVRGLLCGLEKGRRRFCLRAWPEPQRYPPCFFRRGKRMFRRGVSGSEGFQGGCLEGIGICGDAFGEGEDDGFGEK